MFDAKIVTQKFSERQNLIKILVKVLFYVCYFPDEGKWASSAKPR